MRRTILFAALASCGLCSPIADPRVTDAPSVLKRGTCTFSGSNGASSASASQKACATLVLSNVAVPAGQTLDLGDLEEGTKVIFEGTTTWGYEEWDGPLLRIEGSHVTVSGAEGAVLNPDGSRWWDGEGSDGGKTKPYFFYAHSLMSSSINNLYIENTPVQAVSVSGANELTITDMTINNSAGNTEGGHNTDCFDISSSSNVNIYSANCQNQDDCVAVNSGTSITFSGGTCTGGHGLSIGSVGGRSDNTVNGVTFKKSKVENSMNGIRVKATEGDTGTITNVKYEDITLSGISGYGILIEQNYDGGDLHGAPTGGIPITDLTLSGITGSNGVDSSAYNVAIVCASGACSSWIWNGVTVTGGKTYGSCENVPTGASCTA